MARHHIGQSKIDGIEACAKQIVVRSVMWSTDELVQNRSSLAHFNFAASGF